MITDMESLRAAVAQGKPPLLLFSGGLDGAYLILTLACPDLVALTVGLGGDADQAAIGAMCERAGVRHVAVDGRERFVREFVFPAVRGHATYAGGHPICASLSRPLLADMAVEHAQSLGCGVIVHTSNPSQNSLRRFNGALRQSPRRYRGDFGSPFECSHVPRAEKCRALVAAGFPQYADKGISTDTNLWGREFEFGPLDDPERIEIPGHLYVWTGRDRRATAPQRLSLRFERGEPTHLDGQALGGVELIGRLNDLAGRFGIGRYVGLEEIECGAKVQEVREMPAATLLLDAYRRLESACVPYDCIREKMQVEQTWTREAVEGRWFGDLRRACDAFISSVAGRVSGEVQYELQPGGFQPTSLRAAEPLYVRDRRTLE